MGPAIWLAYNAFHDRKGVDEVVARAKNEHGIDVQAGESALHRRIKCFVIECVHL